MKLLKAATFNDDKAGAAGPLDAATFLVDKRPHSTPVVSEKMETSRSNANPGATYAISEMSQLNPFQKEPIPPVSVNTKSQVNMSTQPRSSFPAVGSNVRKTPDSIKPLQSFRVPGVKPSQSITPGDYVPHDPVAAMRKAQMLSGM